MLIGYTRVSKVDGSQLLDLQRDALRVEGIDVAANLYHDFASGVHAGRPGLDSRLRALRKGDVLAVWKLDRLGRNLAHRVHTVQDLSARDALQVRRAAGTVARVGRERSSPPEPLCLDSAAARSLTSRRISPPPANTPLQQGGSGGTDQPPDRGECRMINQQGARPLSVGSAVQFTHKGKTVHGHLLQRQGRRRFANVVDSEERTWKVPESALKHSEERD